MGLVQRGRDLRIRLNARRVEASKGINSAMAKAEAKAIMEHVTSLEEILMGVVASLKKDVKS